MFSNDFKYRFRDNKSKVSVVVSAFILLVAVIAFLVFVGKKNDYGDVDVNDIEKSILATGIIGASNTGKVELLNTETGEVMDTNNLEGEVFIYNKGSDMKSLTAYDPTNSVIYEIEVKGKKLSNSSKELGISDEYSIVNFAYNNNHFIGLLEDEFTFVYKKSGSKDDAKVIDLELTDAVDTYLIVKDYLIFTAGYNVYSYDLEKGEFVSIYMGESSISIHNFKNKTFIHNNFGYERNKSILMDVDPATLYINNVHQYKNTKANVLEGSSNSEVIYFSEEVLDTKDTNVVQTLKLTGEGLTSEKNIMKHSSLYPMSRLNTYGNDGYIYYLEDTNLAIINSKTSSVEFEYSLEADFFMPIY